MGFSKKLGGVVAAAAMIMSGIGGIAPTVKAADASSHYLAFTSDVHGQNSKLETAFLGMPSTVEYVGLIGDMVGEGGGAHPEYTSSSLMTIAQNAFQNINSDSMSIIWADHDISVRDDAGIVKIWNGFESPDNGYNSGEVFKSDDYYIYVIGYYHMLAGGEVSQTAAAEFKAWVDQIEDQTKPIIVLGHVPLAAKRGDNNGAPYWNEALNYAATGVEGITDTEKTAEVARNVFYFYGHNHTVDKTEYYYVPGGTMNIQIDTTAGAKLLSDSATILTTDATDEELGAVKAEGVDVNVYYNALITGYIKTSGNATLMEIGDKKITLTKYNNGAKVSLGTDGTTGDVLGETVEIVRIVAPEEDESEDETGEDDANDADTKNDSDVEEETFIPAVPNTGRPIAE